MFSDDGNRRVSTAKSAHDSCVHWPGTPAARWDQFQFLSFLLSTHFLEPSNFLTLHPSGTFAGACVLSRFVPPGRGLPKN